MMLLSIDDIKYLRKDAFGNLCPITTLKPKKREIDFLMYLLKVYFDVKDFGYLLLPPYKFNDKRCMRTSKKKYCRSMYKDIMFEFGFVIFDVHKQFVIEFDYDSVLHFSLIKSIKFFEL